MKKTKEIELNDFHKARNNRLIRKISEQPSMSSEEFIEQIKRIADQSITAPSKHGRIFRRL